MAELQQRTPSDSGATPATTPWIAAPSSSGDIGLKNATPGGLLMAIAVSRGWTDALGDAAWEQTMRVWTDGDTSGVGVVLLWDFPDDAVAGHDFRISMRRMAGEWTVERIEERYHCRRKLTADGRCA
jgi:hypothetical protein